MDNTTEVHNLSRDLIKSIKEHIRTGYNSWSVNRAIETLEGALSRAPKKDTTVEQGWFRLMAIGLGLFAMILGISGIIFQNQFSGFAFFIVCVAVFMTARHVRRIAGC